MDRLRAFRNIEGLTQKEMGDLLGIPHQAVSQAEAGRRPLFVDVAATGYSTERFETLPTMSEPLHRQRASTREGSRKRAKELLRVAGELFAELGPRSNAPLVAVDILPSPGSLTEVEDRALDVRVGVLRHEESGKIVNLTSAVERAGVCLVPIVGLPGVDGLSSWVAGRQPVIGLNPFQPGDRFRFTLLHELGHIVMHRTKSDVTEDEANRFAGAVLIPEADFDEAMEVTPTLSDFIELKKQWGISVAALVYRARELGYVDDRRYRSLQIQMSRWRRSEPAGFDAAHGQLLPKLIERNGGVQSVAKMSGINPDHIRQVSQWSGLRSV